MNETMKKYQSGEITIEEANAELKAQGAGYYLVPKTADERAQKKAVEDAMGFFEVPDDQKKPVYPQRPDMSRNQALANLTMLQKTVSGVYAVEYDELGYAVQATRM